MKNICVHLTNEKNSPRYELFVDDNKFVDCAIAANAEFLVSNDSHFKVLEQIPFPKVSVLHLKSFTRMLNGYGWNEDRTILNEPAGEYYSRRISDPSLRSG